MSRLALMRVGLAAMAGLVVAAGALLPATPAKAADPYGPYLKFFFSPPDPPDPVVPIPRERVRAILRAEGATMIGAPRLLGFSIIAMGRDGAGAERKFTLDAETGGLLTVTLVRPAPLKPLPPIDPNVAIGRRLGAPVHPAGNLDADHLGTPPPPQPPEQVAPPPPQKAAPQAVVDSEAEPPEAPDTAPDPDAALSPIKPQRKAPGAPKVEKLPQ